MKKIDTNSIFGLSLNTRIPEIDVPDAKLSKRLHIVGTDNTREGKKSITNT